MLELDFGLLGTDNLSISFMAEDKTPHDKKEEGHHHEGKLSELKRLQEAQQQVKEAEKPKPKP